METTDKRILVVDDSLTVRMQIKDLLEDEGYEVVLAKDGESCLKILENQKSDMILLDIVMPGISGLDVCKTIKADSRLREIPVVILSHISDTENKVAGLKAGAEDYVTKPFAVEELNARISSILKTKSLQEELKLAVEAAQQSARARSMFLATMSHEIRTPMNGVMGFAELLGETDLDEEQKECLDAIERSGESLLVIINDILTFSKMESEDIVFEDKDIDLNQVINDVCDLIRIQIRKKPIEVLSSIDPDVPKSLRGDPYRLRQILLNLLGNAAKFTEEGEIVTRVLLKKKEGSHVFLHFEVRDTGIGISQNKLETIFESFTQSDSSSTRKYGGAGLGLSIAQKIAQRLGGDCWAESELGRGSIFHGTAWFDSPALTNIQRKRSARVLLVEDNPVNQKLGRKVIEKLGHEVEVADNGRVAVEMYKTHNWRRIEKWALNGQEQPTGDMSLDDLPFDIILMDMQMPEMDGVEATRKIREKESEARNWELKDKVYLDSSVSEPWHPDQSKRVPIVAITANVLDEHREECLAAGMDDFFTKPIKKDAVSDMIYKWTIH